MLWNVYGLKLGEHTVRLVTTDKADARSKGKRISIYGAAKTFNEGLLASFREMHGLDYVALRPFNVYGPGQIGGGAIVPPELPAPAEDLLLQAPSRFTRPATQAS